MGDTYFERAAALLFPPTGRHAIDVKFFFREGASIESLSEQVVCSFESMDDPTALIESVDDYLTN